MTIGNRSTSIYLGQVLNPPRNKFGDILALHPTYKKKFIHIFSMFKYFVASYYV